MYLIYVYLVFVYNVYIYIYIHTVYYTSLYMLKQETCPAHHGPMATLQPQLQLLKDLLGKRHEAILRQIQMLQLAQSAQTLRQHLWLRPFLQPPK